MYNVLYIWQNTFEPEENIEIGRSISNLILLNWSVTFFLAENKTDRFRPTIIDLIFSILFRVACLLVNFWTLVCGSIWLDKQNGNYHKN